MNICDTSILCLGLLDCVYYCFRTFTKHNHVPLLLPRVAVLCQAPYLLVEQHVCLINKIRGCPTCYKYFFFFNFLAKDVFSLFSETFLNEMHLMFIYIVIFCCLRQMGNSHGCNIGDIDTILAMLWAKKTWVTLAITAIQQSKKWLKSAKIRLSIETACMLLMPLVCLLDHLLERALLL